MRPDEPVRVTGSDAHSAAKADDNVRPHSRAGPLECIARGHAYSLEGNFAADAACFETALSLGGDLPMAHNNLGWVRERQGDRIGALASYRKALELNGSLALAQVNLASLLAEMGRAAEARPIWRALLAADPGNRALLDQVITVNLRAGDLAGASDLADEYAFLSHGSRWFTGSSRDLPVPEEPFPVPLLSAGKLEHDIEQFTYLQERGLLPGELAGITERYRTVLERIAPLGDTARAELSAADRDLIGHVYDRVVYRRPAPGISNALSRTWRPRAAEDAYLHNPRRRAVHGAAHRRSPPVPGVPQAQRPAPDRTVPDADIAGSAVGRLTSLAPRRACFTDWSGHRPAISVPCEPAGTTRPGRAIPGRAVPAAPYPGNPRLASRPRRTAARHVPTPRWRQK